MKVDLGPGIYVLGVSGGVDSMALLDVLRRRSDIRLVVAHLDHGIRPDSDIDRLLVQEIANKHGLVFVYDQANLGPDASEATARKARYDFLRKVQRATGANAIITAHHQDDLLETAIMNMLRGTNRKGLSSLADDKNIRRPLLHVSKKELTAYAKHQQVRWREDSTNTDTKYRRNYVRENIVKKMNPNERKRLLKLLAKTRQTNKTLDLQIANLLQVVGQGKRMNRRLFISLPHAISLELMATWLRIHDIRQFDKKLLEKLVASAKTLASGKHIDVNARHFIKVTKDSLALTQRERY